MEVSRQTDRVESSDKLLVFFGIGNNEPIRSITGKSLTNVQM